MQPAVQSLYYLLDIPNDPTTKYFYFDFFRDLSVANRRSYRQGSVLPLQGLRFVADQTCTLNVSALPFSWVVAESWEASFRAWQKLNRMAMADDDDSERAKYLDFKVYMDSMHKIAADGTNATIESPQPVGHVSGTAHSEVGYEWQYSVVQVPQDLDLQAGTWSMFMLGDNVTSGTGSGLGMIHNYALARARPPGEDPNVPVDDNGQTGGSYLNLMFDFGGGSLQDVVQNVVGQNNEPPYPVGLMTSAAGQPTEEYYPGGANFLGAADQHEFARTSIYSNRLSKTDPATSLQANGYLPGTMLPLGLLKLTVVNHSSGTLNLHVYADMIPGNQRGYMSMSMLEMN